MKIRVFEKYVEYLIVNESEQITTGYLNERKQTEEKLVIIGMLEV